ncbi:hypothetical protein G9P44_000788 [Scheffersomyces stipitis]|nr:hypothetical protein G9P44_000788 [Scheffersomyces stipitis]
MSTAPPNIPFPGLLGWKAMINGYFPSNPSYTEEQYPKLDGKVVIVTGGNTGVGYQTAKSLAGSTNAKVYIFARSEEKALAAIRRMELEVAQEYNKSSINVHFIKLDLGDLTTIKASADEFLSKENRLDIVIHNAGVMGTSVGSKTVQGVELQLGTNCFGPHLLQKYFDPLVIETSKTNKPYESRIVWVASSAHFQSPERGIHYADPNFVDTPHLPRVLYCQSKAVNIMQAIAWPKNHPGADRVLSVSLCPGFLNTDIQRHASGIWKWFIPWVLHDPRYGAYTELYAALNPELKNQGEYYQSFGKLGDIRPDIKLEENVDKAWAYCEEQVKAYYKTVIK